MALKVISDLHTRRKLPVVCGGTNYYIESLLFTDEEVKFDPGKFEKKLREAREKAKGKGLEAILDGFELNLPLDQKQAVEDGFESGHLHELLAIVDLKSANFLHPNDKRKIVNALFAWFKDSDTSNQKLRFLPILIWVHA